MAWFNGDDGYNKGCMFTFFEAMRGPGKTYWSKCRVVKNFLKSGGKFIYLRRYATETKKQKNFFGQISAEFPKVKFDQKGKQLFINDQLSGYLCTLSQSITEKSVSYQDVTTIIFDEFQLPKGHYRYLANEVETFLDFYYTVNRVRDKKNTCRVLFLSNNMAYNPYYDYFHIDLYAGKYRKKDLIYAERWTNPDFVQMAEDTPFGQLIKETPYGNYALAGAEFQRDLTQIGERSKKSILWFNIYVCKKYYGVWGDAMEAKLWISKKCDKSAKTFCLARPDMIDGMALALPREPRIRSLLENYKYGLVWYESEEIRANTAPAISRLVH